MTSSRHLLILVLLTWQLTEAQDKVCIQCATPSMRENWAATGLPKVPSRLKFDKLCSEPGATQIADPLWQSSNCASACFELMLPIDGIYGFVRGCHEQFVYDEMRVISNETGVCEVNKLEGYGTVGFLNNNDETVASAYAGTSFSPPQLAAAESSLFNAKLHDKDITVNGVTGCNAGTTKTCKSCGEYDGSGSCSASTTDTCKGVYCTKTSGKLNGHFYESRGCSSFNPFAKDVCSWTEQTLNVSTGVDSVVVPSRSKRAVELSFQANQCFCHGDECNSAPSISQLVVSLVTVSFLVFS